MVREEQKQVSLIRIMSTDINSEASIMFGLSRIKGISYMFSNAVCNFLGLKKNAKISSLSEKDIEKIENYLSNPEKNGIPTWLLNQRKEYISGENLHLVSKDIDYNELQNRRRGSKIKTNKALRTRAQLPLRGQRTKSNFRRNKTIAAMKAKRVNTK